MADKQRYFLIPHELAQAVVNFLTTQPYAQVFRLIGGMQNLQSATLDPFAEPPALEPPAPPPPNGDANVQP